MEILHLGLNNLLSGFSIKNNSEKHNLPPSCPIDKDIKVHLAYLGE